MNDGPTRRPPRGESEHYEWPDDVTPKPPGQGPITLIVSYGAPFVLLVLFPAIAWIALLPLALMLNWTAHPTHRRRLVWVYLLTGLFSFAPWLVMLLS